MYSAREILFMIKKMESLTLLKAAVITRNQKESELTESNSHNQLDKTSGIPQIAIDKNGGCEDHGAAAAAFEAAFESIRLRWQSFLSLYIRENASLEVNLTSDMRDTALSLELNLSQLETITSVLNQILGGVLVNLRDTYTRFKHTFQANAYIKQK